MIPLVAAPGKASSARRELQAIYNQINASAAQKDVDGVLNDNAPDFTTVDQNGKIHETSDGRQELQDIMNAVDTIKATTTIKSFNETDTDATVVVKDHFVFIASNQANGRTIKLMGDDVSRDYWVKSRGWMAAQTDAYYFRQKCVPKEFLTFHRNNEKAVPVRLRELGTAFHYAGLAPFGESHAQPEIVRG